MQPSLSYNDVRKNCESIYNYCFTSMLHAEDDTLSGFSNVNIHLKALKWSADWWNGENHYKKLRGTLLKTLEAIENYLKEECPLFFYVDEIQKRAVSFDRICLRISESQTFKNSKELCDKANKVKEIFKAHELGVNKQFKGFYMVSVFNEVQRKYFVPDQFKEYVTEATASLPDNYNDENALKKFLSIKRNLRIDLTI